MPQVVIAAGGVIFRKNTSLTEVVLILRNHKWDLPKGSKEPGETVPAAAAREISEEIGIPPPMLVQYLCETRHGYLFDNEAFEKHTHWYSMVLSEQMQHFNPQQEEGIIRVEWFPIDEALELVAFENLRKVLVELKRRL